MLYWMLIAATALISTPRSLVFAGDFREVTNDVGLVYEFKKSWGNPIWGDLNNDGWLDIIVPTHGLAVSHGPMVYLNNRGNSFTDIRTICGIAKAPDLDSNDWHGFSFGDYDSDGILDLYISEGSKGGTISKRDLLFRGRGDGSFDYISSLAGIESSSNRGRCAFWFDYDKDGKLDLFIKNFGGTNVLYKNGANHTLTKTPDGANLNEATLGRNLGTVCSFADYDNDGFVDVLFSGDATTDALYHNNGDGTFDDVSASAGMRSAINGHGVAFGDYDNDGFVDIYIARGHLGSDPVVGGTLYRNNGDGTFTDKTAQAGLGTVANTWAALWGDYDNDGFLDLFVTNAGARAEGTGNANLLYHNNGDGTFTNKAVEEGVALEDGVSLHKGAAWGDYNNDGFLDLLIKDGIGAETDNGTAAFGLHHLLKNSGNGNHYIKINLLGLASNTLGIGSRVAVTFDKKTIYRQNNGGGGGEYASQGSGPLHFGIGTASSATVTVTWPSGTVDTVRSVAANSTLTIIEGGFPRVKLENISTRLNVQTGTDVGITGFIIAGSDSKKVLIRGLGPSLADAGVTGVLTDPVLELHSPDGSIINNDNWRDTQQMDVAATGLAPTAYAEAAIVTTLESGAYTVVLSGQNGATGVGLVEVYDLDGGASSELVNVSTRGLVDTGDDEMIGGVVLGPTAGPNTTLVVRALGPTLDCLGVGNCLTNPTLELHDAQGTLVAFNSNWQDDLAQAASIEAVGLAPSDPRESAIYRSVPAGAYTALVGSSGGGGVALLEIYKVH